MTAKLTSIFFCPPMSLDIFIINPKHNINKPNAMVGANNRSGLIKDNNPTDNANKPIATVNGIKDFPRFLAFSVDFTNNVTK